MHLLDGDFVQLLEALGLGNHIHAIADVRCVSSCAP